MREFNVSLFPVITVALSGNVPERTLHRYALEVLGAVVRAAVSAEVDRDRGPPLLGDRHLERAPCVDVLAEVVDEHIPLVTARPALAAQDDAAGALDLDRASLHGGQYPGAEPG